MKIKSEYKAPIAGIMLFSVYDIITLSETSATTQGWDGDDDPVELPKTEI